MSIISVFDRLYKEGKNNFENILSKYIENNSKKMIITANPETIMLYESNDTIKEMLEDTSVEIIPDGIGVVKAAKMLNIDIKERITGIDIANFLLNYANENKKSVYFFGAKEDVIKKLKNVIKNEYPKIIISGMQDGYIKNKEEVFRKIAKKEPDIILVALGIPVQETLIYNNLDCFKKGIFVGVGGSFDVISGSKKRAPKLFIKTNTEWLYRIIREPKRIKRFYKSNIKFITKIKKIKKQSMEKK